MKCSCFLLSSNYFEFGRLPDGDVTVDVLREVALLLDSVPQEASWTGALIGPAISTVEITAAALRVGPVAVCRAFEESPGG